MMGGMGGGMMGGMGGGMMGGMGGGMRSVPPTGLPTALLKPGHERHLPTRLVSVTPPDPQLGARLCPKGERLRILGDIAQVNDNPQVSESSQAPGGRQGPRLDRRNWFVAAHRGLDWESIGDLSQKWANDYELTVARDFVDRLDSLSNNETGHLQIELHGNDEASNAMAAEAIEALKGKFVLGLQAEIGMPERPDGPTVACRVPWPRPKRRSSFGVATRPAPQTGSPSVNSRYPTRMSKGSSTRGASLTNWPRESSTGWSEQNWRRARGPREN